MIKMKLFSGDTREIDGKYYFLNVDDVVNEFIESNNIEYIDCKFINDDSQGYLILLVYKEVIKYEI